MSRLTAKFDLEDRVSRKLNRITGNLERVRSITDPPIVITATDRATRVARKITRFVRSDIAKTHEMVISGRDQVTKRILTPLNNYIRRRMPRSYEIMVQGIDRATPVVQRIQRLTRGALLGSYMFTVLANDRASPVINRVTQFAKASFHRGFTFSVRMIDLASNGLRNVGNFAGNAVAKTYTMTVRVLDLATKPLRAIANVATSTLGLLGAAGGVYGGVVAPLNMVMDRQGTQTAFEVLLGSAEAAHDRVDELTQFAGSTPFVRDEIFKSSRLLQTFTGDALSTGEGLRLVGDVAAGTQTDFQETAMWFGRLYDGMKSGRPIGEATSRLQEMGAISGESRAKLEKLAESGKDISEIWPQATKEFSRYNGMMEKLSDNLANLLSGAKQFFVQNMMMKWGEGLEKALSPALNRFRDWRGENAAAIREMGNQFERLGEKAAKSVLNPLSRIAGFAGDQFKFLFPVNDQMREFAIHDPDLMKYVTEMDQMGFEARLDIVIGNGKDAFKNWWDTTGQGQLDGIADRIGRTYGGVINGVINGLLGSDNESTGNAFIDAGMTAGRSFADSFIDALDPVDLTKRIGAKFVQVNWDMVTNPSKESFGTALVTNLLAAAAIAKVGKMLSGPLKLGKSVWGGAKWAGGKVFGGSKRTPNTTAPTLRTPAQNATRQERNSSKLPKWLSGTGNAISKGLKRVPLIGTGIAALGLLGASKDERAGEVGSVLGGLGGAATGAAIGSIVPGVGTAIGGVIGGILGSLGGGKLGEWIGNLDFASIGSSLSEGFDSSITWIKDTWGSFSDWFGESVWSPIADGSVEAGEWIKNAWNDFSSWFGKKVWGPIENGATKTTEWITDSWKSAEEWIHDKWSSLSGWFEDSVWTPLEQGALLAIDFTIGLFDMGREYILKKWNDFSSWFDETVWSPISVGSTKAIDWVSAKFDEGWTWVTDKWSAFNVWFNESVWSPLSESATFALDWVSTKFGESLLWVQETWATAKEWFQDSVWTPLTEKATEVGAWVDTKFDEAWIGIQETWNAASGWFHETIWNPISEGATLVGLWIKAKFSESLGLIQETWGTVTAWFDETIWTPLTEAADNTKIAFNEKFEEAKTLVSETWSPVAEWFTTTVWDPITTGVETVTGAITSGFETAWGVVSGIWGNIQDIWGNATSWVSGVAERGRNVRTGNGNTVPAYAKGGLIDRPHVGLVGEAGPEMIVPLTGNRNHNLRLWQQAGALLGATNESSVQLPQEQVAAVQGTSRKSNSKSRIRDININFNGDQHYSDDMDAEKVAQIATKAVKNALEEEYSMSGDMVIDD